MPIPTGTKLGPYEITGALGAGGMGEVYRARDPRLGREVAIKVLPSEVAGDPVRMARFEREAQMLAALKHSNIATIHGLEDWNGTRALVMELVEGPTLAERIAQGALPVDEVVTIARQIAEALEYAHERGIIHRDLKPANIKIDPEGQVRILDFGLAKALADDSAAQDISSSPTLSMAATKAGLILGTAAYMAPEQARGKTVDRRADIWAFGCVLYEMLTGRPAFHGDNVSDILASVLKTEPDWQLPAGTPAALARLVRRCVEKDPRRRLQAIGEARIALEAPLATEEGARSVSPPATRAPGREKIAWGAVGVLTIIAAMLGWATLKDEPSARPVKRSVINLPANEILPNVTTSGVMSVSRDGKFLVLIGSRRGSGTGWQLYLREMEQPEFRPLEGTEEAYNPFFSHDGKWIGFHGAGKLKKIPVQGGTATTICDVNALRGATWGPDDTIIFAESGGVGLFRVPAAGGTPRRLTMADPVKPDAQLRWPHFLPGGKAILFSSQSSQVGAPTANLEVLDLTSNQRRIVVQGGTAPAYLSSGHLVFTRGEALYAAPFDLDRLEATAPAVPVAQDVWGDLASGASHFAVSDDGTLIYIQGAIQSRTSKIGFVDRKGVGQALSAVAQQYVNPALSPDGQRVAVTVQGSNTDVWIFDIKRGAMTRLTFQPGEDETSAWTPDGKKVAYCAALEDKGRSIAWRNADGSGSEEVLWSGGTHLHIGSFSPDGRVLTFMDYDNETKGDIWYLPILENKRQPQKFLQTKFNERSPMFSPDGKWIAYTSDETGRDEVYVQPFPGPGGKWQVSTSGGYGPAWSSGGRELFFRSGTRMMVVEVTRGDSFSASTPRQVFESNFESVPRRESNYDIAPDGRFLVIQPPESGAGVTQVQMVTNWTEELKRKVPVGKK